jgi:hypothetical protein
MLYGIMNVNDEMEIISKKQIRNYYNMLPKHLPEWAEIELQKLEYQNTFQVSDNRGKWYENEDEFLNIMTKMKKTAGSILPKYKLEVRQV